MNICPILVGRDRELEALDEALGVGGVVLVAGEAGIGKSRLLREFATLAGDRGHRVIWGRPEAVTAPGPYSLVLDLLDDLSVAVPDVRDDAGALADAISLREEGRPEPPARQIAARVRGLLGGIGRPVLLIEDLHAADEPSQAVVAHLARTARDDGMLVVGTFRPEEAKMNAGRLLDVLARDRVAQEVRLGPLPSVDLAAMLAAMWDGDVPAETRAEIERLGEGIPFFIEELAAARAGGGTIVPESVARGTLTRLQALGDDARNVIRAASLTAGALDPAVLAAVCDIPEGDLPRAILAGIGAGLLADEEGRLVFRHALVREAIAGGVVSVERRDLHRRLALAIEAVHGNDLGPHARALATHHLEAGDREAAAAYLALAGERALGVAVPQDARALFEEALELVPGDEIAVRAKWGLAEALRRLNEPDRAIELLRDVVEAKRAAGDDADAALALMRLGEALATRADPETFVVLDETIALARTAGDEMLVEALLARGIAHQAFSDPTAAGPWFTEALDHASRLGDDRLLAVVHEACCVQAQWTGDRAAQVAHITEATARARATGRPDLITKTARRHGLILALEGRCEEALAALGEVRERVVHSIGPAVRSLDYARMVTYWRMGEPARAEEVAVGLDSFEFHPTVRRIRVWALAMMGEIDAARQLIRHWWQLAGGEEERRHHWADPWGAPMSAFSAGTAQGAELLLWAEGVEPEDLSLEDAVRYTEFQVHGDPDGAVEVLVQCARILLAAGDVDAAEGMVARADAVEGRADYTRAWVAMAQGLVLHARGDAGGGQASLRRSGDLFASVENRCDRARALRFLAEHGAEDAPVLLKEALSLATASGATFELSRIESAMRRIGLRPRAGRPKGSGRAEGTLSRREQEVVSLVATGATNAEIASRLFLSLRTVEDHIGRATKRLGVTRAGLAAWAAKQGLV